MIRFQKAVQLPQARGVAHFAERLGLDLPNAFTGDLELMADVFQRAGVAITDAKAKLEHLPFAFIQAAQHVAQHVLEQAEAGDVEGILRRLVLDEIAKAGVIAVADR